MILTCFVIPITFSVGFLVGKLAHHKIGVAISAIAGAVVYMAGLMVLTEPLMTFPIHAFDLPTLILMATFGALFSLLGWYIGVNYEFLRKQKSPKKTVEATKHPVHPNQTQTYPNSTE